MHATCENVSLAWLLLNALISNKSGPAAAYLAWRALWQRITTTLLEIEIKARASGV
jgi:hypothetical protein